MTKIQVSPGVKFHNKSLKEQLWGLIGFYVFFRWLDRAQTKSKLTCDVIPSVLINRLLPLFLFPMLSLSLSSVSHSLCTAGRRSESVLKVNVSVRHIGSRERRGLNRGSSCVCVCVWSECWLSPFTVSEPLYRLRLLNLIKNSSVWCLKKKKNVGVEPLNRASIDLKQFQHSNI